MDHQRTSFLNENNSGEFLGSDEEDMAQDFAAFVKENKQNQSYVNTSMLSTSSSKQFNTSRMHDSHCRTGIDHSRMSSFSYMNPIPKFQKPVRSPIPMDNDFENCNPNVTKRDKGAPSKGSQKMSKISKSKKKHNSNDKEVKVLVIGATGAGKSSLINLFYVWSQKWSPIDLVSRHKRVVIRTKHLDGDGEAETDVKNQGVSQTTKAKHYSFELKNENTGVHYSLNFLDTPGLGDTSGIEKDDFHLELIMDTVGKTDGLNAILLVMNGADARINARVKYIMIRLQGMIPDALRQNLVVLLTNVGLEPNLDIRKVLDFKIDDNNVFYYDNQIFALDPSKISNHNVQRKVNQSYKDSIDTLSAMLDRISSCSVKPTKEFIVIKEARDELKKKLVECNDADARIYKKKQELQKLAADIASGQLKIGDLQKQLNQTVSEDNFTSQPTSYHNTTCLTCKSCCHEHCMLNETTQQGVPYFQQCAAFNGNATCNACSHSYTSHVHLRLKYVKTTTQVQKFDPNIQASIQKAQNDADAQNKAHNAIDAEIRKLDAELQKSQGEIMSIVAKMQKVCSRFDYIKEIEACINVLDEQIDTATSDFSQTLNEDDATKVDGLQKTKAKMVKLKNDLVKYLKSSKKQE